jgi:hypothetical protein
MIQENAKCPRCEAQKDLYKGSDGRYLCMTCWIEKRATPVVARKNGKSRMAYADFKRRIRA